MRGRGSHATGSASASIAVAVAMLAACGTSEPGGSGPAGSGGSGGSAGSGSAAASTSSGADVDEGGSTVAHDPDAEGPLVDLTAWGPVAEADDPWANERPADAVCDAGYLYEDMVFEVDTEICTFGTFVQPSLLPVRAGQHIELILLHDNLYSPDGEAEAHVAIGLGGEMVWETAIPIPILQGLVRPTFEAPLDLPAGAPVHFHVHNHGYNNYRMIGLDLL